MKTESSQIRIVPNKKSGTVVTPYASNPEFGYIQLEQSYIDESGGWYREVTRTTLMRGTTELLQKIVKASKDLTVPGNLIVLEYLESKIPADIAKVNLRSDVSFEEAIEPYLKRAGQDGVVLKSNGERICRFVKLDRSGLLEDIKIAHDNHSEVAESKKKSLNAVLPGEKGNKVK